MPAIARLFPDAKVIACVRELSWVIDSIERLIHAMSLALVDLQLQRRRHGLYPRQRCGGADGMVGAPYDALKQACFGAQRDNLLLVQYER